MCLSVRKMKVPDIQDMKNSLLGEGTILEIDKMYPENTYIWKIDDIFAGFFHFRIEQNVPSLRHFYISKDFRNINNARGLLNEYKKIVHGMGFNVSFISVNKPYLEKLVEYKFKKGPYARQGNVTAYLVEV